MRTDRDYVFVGMATAEKLLEKHYPKFSFSRFRLRRMCMAGELPCAMVRGGRQVRYLVRVIDVVERFSATAAPVVGADAPVPSTVRLAGTRRELCLA